MNKAFLVVSGEWSDYAVHAVTLDFELAQRAVDAMNVNRSKFNRCEIEAVDLIDTPDDVVRRPQADVSLRRDTLDVVGIEIVYELPFDSRRTQQVWWKRHDDNVLTTCVNYVDETQAVKAARDIIGRWKAEQMEQAGEQP